MLAQISTGSHPRGADLTDSDVDQLRIDTVATEREFAALETAWTAAADSALNRSPFLSFDWFAAAWAWRRLDSTLALHVIRKREHTIGLLPLIRNHERRNGVRRLELLTVPDTQITDVVAAKQDITDVCEAVARHLAARKDWDVLWLDYLAPDGAVIQELLPALRRHGIRVETGDCRNNPCISLNGRWSDYYLGRSRRLKKANNLAANRLTKAGDISIEWLRPNTHGDAQIEAALEAVIDISSRSWKQTTTNSLDHPGPQAFIRALSSAGARRGWLSIWMLRLDGEPIAMEYQLIDDGQIYALRADFDQRYDNLSPGSHLFRQLIEALFDRGYKRYNLGPGENPYKRRWTDVSTPLHQAVAYNTTLRGSYTWLWQARIKPALRSLRNRAATKVNSRRERADESDSDG